VTVLDGGDIVINTGVATGSVVDSMDRDAGLTREQIRER
jgi:hypothetical protein